jgi:hypothetical protein
MEVSHGHLVAAQVTSCQICSEQSGNAVGFLTAHQFSLPILIPPNALFLLSSMVDIKGNLRLYYQGTQSHPS